MKWILPLLVYLPAIALADPVAIRSGEHDTFSRLVFSIEEGTDWRVMETDTGFALQLEDEVDGFAIEGVFDRIPRDRLLDLIPRSGSRLDFLVTCNCQAEAFLWRPDRLVVDIVDGQNPIETLEAADAPLEPALRTAMREDVAFLPDLLGLPNGLTLNATPLPTRDLTSSMVLADAPESASADQSLQTAEAALLEGLSRAATQGYLTPTNVTPPETSGSVSPADPEPSVVEETLAVSPSLGLDISTATDETLAGISRALEAREPQVCLDNETFDLASWADDRPFNVQLASLAEPLSGSFGQEPIAAHTSLAQLYLHFGFGAEALLALRANSASSQTRVILAELAGLIDDYDGPYPKLSAQRNCASLGSFWGFLASGELPDDDANLDYLMQGYFSIPQPLRGHLSARVADHFLSEGRPDLAEQVLQSANVPDIKEESDVQAIRADLAEIEGDVDRALALLREEVRTNPHVTPQVVNQLLDLYQQHEIVPSEEDLLIAAGLAAEYRAGPMYLKLQVNEARGWVAKGEYERALALVTPLEDESARATVDFVFDKLASNGAASTFLQLVFAGPPPELSGETRNAIAQRLIDLGFPRRALTVLDAPTSQDAASERRYLMAEAGIEAGEYIIALEAISGINSDRAKVLRASAFDHMGDFESALTEAPADPETSNGLGEFRAEAWERLAVMQDDPLGEFAQVRLDDSGATLPETLTERRTLVEQSQESRRAIEGLLQQFETPVLSE
ncbi:hypothetical protein [Pseudooctadecabacter jejudonensis]|uniref:Tetratricopeptide repeat protein n=1 Tax=Pseudooctadecabacter jejudonensis TaxID=1391910 RepID=A0A1Y5S877_9RHOB|nr:hypothetical protein [Pseudooctadecabacter jejudonensis]SLN32058.1 hypothetical protein PSJ8397_01495 [Pseudooctadecabacter jejudonensis]